MVVKRLRPSYGAGLLIIRPSDGHVLLLRRSDQVSMPGHWSPPGGSEEPGETPEETAYREAREELGSLPELVKIRDEGYWHANGPFYAFGTFAAQLGEEQEGWEPTLNEENDAWGWFAPGDLPQPMLRGTIPTIRALVEMAWHWKPPSMGIAVTEKSYTVCKVVNVNEAGPDFMSSSFTVIDETTELGLSFIIPFDNRVPLGVVLPTCRRTALDDTWDRYQRLLGADPDLTLGCVQGVVWDDVLEMVVGEFRQKAKAKPLKKTEKTVEEVLTTCLR